MTLVTDVEATPQPVCSDGLFPSVNLAPGGQHAVLPARQKCLCPCRRQDYGGCPGAQNLLKFKINHRELQASAKLLHIAAQSRLQVGHGTKMVIQSSLLGAPTGTFPRNFAIVVPPKTVVFTMFS